MMDSFTTSRMNIGSLRRSAPNWTWTAKHHGMGYEYEGRRDAEIVRVYAVAVHCGPAEDDFATQWRVDDGETSFTYAEWLIR